jgi:hypothetical protein
VHRAWPAFERTDDLATTGWIPTPRSQFGSGTESHPAQGRQVCVGEIVVSWRPILMGTTPHNEYGGALSQGQRDHEGLQDENRGTSTAAPGYLRDIEEI